MTLHSANEKGQTKVIRIFVEISSILNYYIAANVGNCLKTSYLEMVFEIEHLKKNEQS